MFQWFKFKMFTRYHNVFKFISISSSDKEASHIQYYLLHKPLRSFVMKVIMFSTFSQVMLFWHFPYLLNTTQLNSDKDTLRYRLYHTSLKEMTINACFAFNFTTTIKSLCNYFSYQGVLIINYYRGWWRILENIQ